MGSRFTPSEEYQHKLGPNKHRDRRWCSEAAWFEVTPSPTISRSATRAADGARPTSRKHAVENGDPDRCLGLLAAPIARTKSRPDDGLVASHRGLHQRTLAVAADLLPAQSTHRLDHEQVRVARRWI